MGIGRTPPTTLACHTRRDGRRETRKAENELYKSNNMSRQTPKNNKRAQRGIAERSFCSKSIYGLTTETNDPIVIDE